MSAIDAAWRGVERGDPMAFRPCVAAMSRARDVLAELQALDESDEASTA